MPPLEDPGRRLTVHRVQARWLGIAPVWRGALWMLLSALLFAVMGMLVKWLGSRLDSFQVAFFRAGFGFLIILPFALAAGPSVLRPKRPGMHLLRGLLGASGMSCSFYALAHLPLAQATAYSFTKPLFLVLLAALFLGEKVRLRRLSATIVGFLGVLVMMRPTGGIEPAALVAVFGTALTAGVVVTVKLLLRTERPVTVMFWFGLISSLLTLLPALYVWVPPTSRELLLLLATGAVGASAQSAMLRGYLLAEATALAPFSYVQLIFAGVLGYVVFAEVPGLQTLIGAAIIVGSTLYIVYREAALARQAKLPAKEKKADSALNRQDR